MPSNFMAAVTICSDFGAPKIKSDTFSPVSPSISHEVMGQDAMILVFCGCGFYSICSLMEKDKRTVQASWWEGLAVGKTGSCSAGQGHAQ